MHTSIVYMHLKLHFLDNVCVVYVYVYIIICDNVESEGFRLLDYL